MSLSVLRMSPTLSRSPRTHLFRLCSFAQPQIILQHVNVACSSFDPNLSVGKLLMSPQTTPGRFSPANVVVLTGSALWYPLRLAD